MHLWHPGNDIEPGQHTFAIQEVSLWLLGEGMHDACVMLEPNRIAWSVRRVGMASTQITRLWTVGRTRARCGVNVVSLQTLPMTQNQKEEVDGDKAAAASSADVSDLHVRLHKVARVTSIHRSSPPCLPACLPAGECRLTCIRYLLL